MALEAEQGIRKISKNVSISALNIKPLCSVVGVPRLLDNRSDDGYIWAVIQSEALPIALFG